MQPPRTTAPSPLDPALSDPAIAGHDDIVGELQAGMARAADTAIMHDAATVKKINAVISRTLNKVDKHQNGLVSDIIGKLGATDAENTAPSEATIAALGTFAATTPAERVFKVDAALPGAPAPAAPTGFLCDNPSPLPPDFTYTQGGALYLAGPPITVRLFATCKNLFTGSAAVWWAGVDAAGQPTSQPPPGQGYVDTGVTATIGSASTADGLARAWFGCNCVANFQPGPGPGPVELPLPPPPLTLPPPPPAAPAPPAPPDATNPLDTARQPPVACTDLQIPDIFVIGSPQFCAAKDDIKTQLIALGNKIVAVVSGQQFDFAAAAINKDTKEAGGLYEQLVTQGVLSAVLEWSAKGDQRVLGAMKDLVRCWLQTLVNSRSCNVSEVVMLAIVKGAVEILQRFRLGWDIAIWGTLDITVHIPPLVKVLDYLIADACNDEIPSVGETIESYMQNLITEDVARCWLSLRGCNWDVWSPVVQSRRHRLEIREFIQWGRRIGVDDKEIGDGLRYFGVVNDNTKDAVMGLYDELPTISDHLHWLQRNVFDSHYVKDFSLLDGFDTDAQIGSLPGMEGNYATRFPSGRNFWEAFGHDLRALGMKKEYAALHYAAHWINPAPGQLAEMVMRLRPGRVDPSIQFTTADFLRVLAEQDVAPYFRQRLLAIAYRVLPLRQLNAATQQGRFDRAELVNRWQDIGFSPGDAAVMADTSLVQAARTTTTALHGYTPSLVSDLAQYDAIDRDTALAKLAPQGFTPIQVDELLAAAADRALLREKKKYQQHSINAYVTLAVKAYEDGTIDRANVTQSLLNAGYPPLAARLEIETADLRQEMATIDAATKAVHKAFLLGEVDADQAAQALQLAGVVPGAIPTYMRRWQLELTVPRKASSGAKVMQWALKGLLSVTNARIRLANLGYPATDIELMVAEAEQSIAHAQLLAKQKNAKALAQAAKSAEAAKRAVQKGYCRTYTPARLKSWYARRVIDGEYLAKRLQECGYTDDERDKLTKEAQLAREALDQKAEKKGTVGIEYTGPGADAAK